MNNEINVALEDGMYDANPIREFETQSDFDIWAKSSENGYASAPDGKIFSILENTLYVRVGDGWAEA